MKHKAVIITHVKRRESSLTRHWLAAYCLYLRFISEKVASTILEMKIKNIYYVYLTHRWLQGKCAYSSSDHYSNNQVIAFK